MITCVVFSAKWIMGPIVRAAKDRQYPPQFSVADFLCLLFLLQLSLALIHWGLGAETPAGTRWAFEGFAWTALAALWWSGVRTLSCAGMHNPWLRCVFLAIAIPVTLGVVMALPVLAVAVSIMILSGHSAGSELAKALVATAGTLAVAFAMGRFTRWILGWCSATESELATTPTESTESTEKTGDLREDDTDGGRRD